MTHATPASDDDDNDNNDSHDHKDAGVSIHTGVPNGSQSVTCVAGKPGRNPPPPEPKSFGEECASPVPQNDHVGVHRCESEVCEQRWETGGDKLVALAMTDGKAHCGEQERQTMIIDTGKYSCASDGNAYEIGANSLSASTNAPSSSLLDTSLQTPIASQLEGTKASLAIPERWKSEVVDAVPIVAGTVELIDGDDPDDRRLSGPDGRPASVEEDIAVKSLPEPASSMPSTPMSRSQRNRFNRASKLKLMQMMPDCCGPSSTCISHNEHLLRKHCGFGSPHHVNFKLEAEEDVTSKIEVPGKEEDNVEADDCQAPSKLSIVSSPGLPRDNDVSHVRSDDRPSEVDSHCEGDMCDAGQAPSFDSARVDRAKDVSERADGNGIASDVESEAECDGCSCEGCPCEGGPRGLVDSDDEEDIPEQSDSSLSVRQRERRKVRLEGLEAQRMQAAFESYRQRKEMEARLAASKSPPLTSMDVELPRYVVEDKVEWSYPAKTTGISGAIPDGKLKTLNVLTRRMPRESSLSLMEGEDKGWVEIEVTIDSGACDTVMPTSLCSHISIITTADSRRGMEYEVANGETIPNVGERHCLQMSEDSQQPKRITFQVADIHKPLLSVSRCADLGYKCVLDEKGGGLIDTTSGEIIPLHRRGNLYVMRAWIRQDKSSDFTRPQ